MRGTSMRSNTRIKLFTAEVLALRPRLEECRTEASERCCRGRLRIYDAVDAVAWEDERLPAWLRRESPHQLRRRAAELNFFFKLAGPLGAPLFLPARLSSY